MDTFNVFIVFPDETSVADAITEDEDSYIAYLNSTKDLIDRADCEKGASLFYDGLENSTFINALSDLANLGDFYLIEPAILMNELLRNAIDWAENLSKHQPNNLYILWDFGSCNIVPAIPPSVKEAFEYQKEAGINNKCLLLNIGNDFYPQKKTLFVFKDDSTYANPQTPIFVKIAQVNDFEGLDLWFKNNRISRQLNRIDQRHNEQSPDYIPGKSPILYDLRRNEEMAQHVQSLLNNAVTDQYESKDLMNYDSKKQRYIWFEYENDNPQNQYHAYHLAKPTSHEEDAVAISKIPKRAKRFIDK